MIVFLGGVQVKPSSDNQMGEDEVFMTLDLPLEPSDSKSNSEGTGSNRNWNLASYLWIVN